MFFLYIYLTCTENLIWCCVPHGCQIKACVLELRLANSASVYDIHTGQTQCNTFFKEMIPLRKAVISPRNGDSRGLWLPCKGGWGSRMVSAWQVKKVIKFRLGPGENASSCLAQNAICKIDTEFLLAGDFPLSKGNQSRGL